MIVYDDIARFLGSAGWLLQGSLMCLGWKMARGIREASSLTHLTLGTGFG